MKIYNEPHIELLALPSADIIQNSGNDPFLNEADEWNAGGELPELKPNA